MSALNQLFPACSCINNKYTIIHDVLLYSGGYPFRNIQKQRLNCTSTFSIESGIAFANNEMAFFACFKKEFGSMHDSVYNY